MPIDRNLCKLMTEDLAAAYDHLEAQFDRVRDSLPQLWARKEVTGLAERLAALKARMERPRYYVGFLGRSQVGKSSTLNSILKAPTGQGPGTGGAGAPMTSNVTRLYRLDPAQAAEHSVTLRFMTPAQYRRRRDDLFGFLGFRPDEADDAVLAQVEEMLRREADDPDTQGKPASEKTEDRRYLAGLLRSYKRYSNLVTDPPRVQPGKYAERASYTNHPQGQEPWPYLLLSQVEIGYRTDAISPRIELIDLPGLGARLFSDDLLTERFMDQLDGALVFQSTEQVAGKEAYDLLAKLGQRFRRMKGRVWMIITKFDGLTHDHYGGSGDRVNILDNLAKTLADNRVPGDQVLLVGNQYRQHLIGPDGEVRRPTAELLRIKLGLEVDENNRPVLPEGFKRHPELAQAFLEVIRDGGIDKVSRVIGETLAQNVEHEVREAVGAEVRALQSDLRRLVESAMEAMRLDSGGFRRAVQWKVRLQQARQALDRDRAVLEAPTLRVIGELQAEFLDALCPPNLALAKPQLRKAHSDYCRVLRDQTTLRYKTELVPSVFVWVSERFREANATLGEVRLLGQPSPLKAWGDLSGRDGSDLAWLAPRIEYEEPALFPSGDDDVQLRIGDYREAMKRKIETVCHRSTLEVSRRIKGHIDALIEGLSLLNEAENHVDTAPPAVFQELLDALA